MSVISSLLLLTTFPLKLCHDSSIVLPPVWVIFRFGHYEQRCYKCVSSSFVKIDFLFSWKCTQAWNCWVPGSRIFNNKELPKLFPRRLYHVIHPSAVKESSMVSSARQYSNGCQVVTCCGLNLHFLIKNDIECLSLCSLSSPVSSLVKGSSR